MFNLPQRWYAPALKIWDYIKVYSPESEFCHIDIPPEHRQEHQRTKMPQSVEFDKRFEEESETDLLMNPPEKIVPSFGKPKHKAKILYVKREKQEIIGFMSDDGNLLSDGQGFWIN